MSSFPPNFSIENIETDINCPNVNNFVFTTSDKLTSFSDALPYINTCFDQNLSTNLLDVSLSSSTDSSYTYSVTYCCEVSLVLTSDMCFASWSYDCSSNSISDYSIGCGALFSEVNRSNKSELVLKWNSWINYPNSIRYYRPVFYCNQGCFEQNFTSSDLSTPPLPNTSICDPVIPRENPTPTFTYTLPSTPTSDPIEVVGILTGGDKPYFSSESILCGISEVSEKPSNTDLDHRVFYKSIGDYKLFYESEVGILNKVGGTEISNSNSIGSAVKASDNFNLFPEDPSYISDNTKGDSSYAAGGTMHILNPDLDPDFFVNVLIRSDVAPTPTPTLANEIEDQSLFQKIYTYDINSIDLSSADLNLCSLNSNYWFKELPNKIYNNDNWLNLDPDNLPHFTINSELEFGEGVYSFESGDSHLYSTSLNYNSENNFIKLKSFPIGYSLSPESFFGEKFVRDPVYDCDIYVNSCFLYLSVSYVFNPDVRFLSSDYLSTVFPIKRTEKLFLYISPFKGISNLEYNTVLPDFGEDKTVFTPPPGISFLKGSVARLF